MSYIHAENLSKRYGDGNSSVVALHEVGFDVEAGEFVAVMGESGSGKSTLLSIMGALNTPTSGSYTVDDIPIYSLGRDRRADFRREFLGFVFQSFHLVPYLTLAENVMLPLAVVPRSNKEKRALAEEALARVGLRTKASRLPSQISGGEQERVAIARAVVNEPPILLADEPTGNLDTKTTREIMSLLEDLNRDGMTIVMVTHSPQCARYAQRILRMSDGSLVHEERRSRDATSDGAEDGPSAPAEREERSA